MHSIYGPNDLSFLPKNQPLDSLRDRMRGLAVRRQLTKKSLQSLAQRKDEAKALSLILYIQVPSNSDIVKGAEDLLILGWDWSSR